jgi:hypothetical protein
MWKYYTQVFLQLVSSQKADKEVDRISFEVVVIPNINPVIYMGLFLLIFQNMVSSQKEDKEVDRISFEAVVIPNINPVI